MNHSSLTQSLVNRLAAPRRKPVRFGSSELVRIQPLLSSWSAPIQIESLTSRLQLPAWARENQRQIESLLRNHRALLFRGFSIGTVDAFHDSARALVTGPLLDYGASSARGLEAAVNGVSAEATIPLHNEGTRWKAWPLKILVCALKAAEQGGETPVADVRNVCRRISPEIRNRFREKHVMCVHNYDGSIGISWQEAFHTSDKEAVEAFCRENGMEAEWLDDVRLRTRQIQPAIRRHPQTGEELWFNDCALLHISSRNTREQSALLSAYTEEDLPSNTYYGDGSRIELEVVEEIRQAFIKERIVFAWRDGDILVLDNMTMAHGQQPYTGDRNVVVATAEPTEGESASTAPKA